MEQGQLVVASESARESRLNRGTLSRHVLEWSRQARIQRVRVERLARGLEVTEGSFYGHFTDCDDFGAQHPAILKRQVRGSDCGEP